MNKKISKKLILISLILTSFLIHYHGIQDETIKVHLAYDMITGRCGGKGEGTWNAAGSLFTADFTVNPVDEEQEITFSISGMTILTSIPVLPESSCELFPVLGTGDIIDPERILSKDETIINSWFFGVCSPDLIRIIPH